MGGFSLAGVELFQVAEFSRMVGDLQVQIAQALHCNPAMLSFFQGGEQLTEHNTISDFASIIAKAPRLQKDAEVEAKSKAEVEEQVLNEAHDEVKDLQREQATAEEVAVTLFELIDSDGDDQI